MKLNNEFIREVYYNFLKVIHTPVVYIKMEFSTKQAKTEYGDGDGYGDGSGDGYGDGSG